MYTFSQNGSTLSTNDGTYSLFGSTGTWTGSASSVTLSSSGSGSANRITKIVITYTAGSSNNPPATPVFSPAGGAVGSGTSVQITSNGATSIRYTTDGTNPDVSTGTIYDDSNRPTITSATTLKAIGINNYGTSSVATANYTIAAGTTYELVTSTNGLEDGAKCIIISA